MLSGGERGESILRLISSSIFLSDEELHAGTAMAVGLVLASRP